MAGEEVVEVSIVILITRVSGAPSSFHGNPCKWIQTILEMSVHLTNYDYDGSFVF